MRGRIGGIIGFASQPFAGSASRMWALGDVYAAKRGAYYTDMWYGQGPWPSSNWTIGLPTVPGYYGPIERDWADATATGEATFSPTVTSPSVGTSSFSYFWQRSTDAGASWSVLAGSDGTAMAEPGQYGGNGTATVSLTRTGQTIANDEDRYRIVVTAGLKTFFGQTLALRYDTVTLSHDGGLTSNWNNYVQNLTVAAGVDFSFRANGGFLSVKYENPNGAYEPTSVVMQRSDDGGATWQSQTPDYTNMGLAEKSYTASASDNGAKWRGAWPFQGQTYYGPVATLTVT